MTEPIASPDAMLRFADVTVRTGLSRTTLWRKISAGTFPAPIQLSENSVGWPEHLIVEWLESRPRVNYAPETAAGQEANAA